MLKNVCSLYAIFNCIFICISCMLSYIWYICEILECNCECIYDFWRVFVCCVCVYDLFDVYFFKNAFWVVFWRVKELTLHLIIKIMNKNVLVASVWRPIVNKCEWRCIVCALSHSMYVYSKDKYMHFFAFTCNCMAHTFQSPAYCCFCRLKQCRDCFSQVSMKIFLLMFRTRHHWRRCTSVLVFRWSLDVCVSSMRFI